MRISYTIFFTKFFPIDNFGWNLLPCLHSSPISTCTVHTAAKFSCALLRFHDTLLSCYSWLTVFLEYCTVIVKVSRRYHEQTIEYKDLICNFFFQFFGGGIQTALLLIYCTTQDHVSKRREKWVIADLTNHFLVASFRPYSRKHTPLHPAQSRGGV